VPNTSLTVNTRPTVTVFVVSPGYPSRMDNDNLQCSCLIKAISTNNVQVYFTVRYVDWNADNYINSCWGTLHFETYDSATNPEFCISDQMKTPLINRTLTRGLLVNFRREYTRWNVRAGYFRLEINSAGIIISSLNLFINQISLANV